MFRASPFALLLAVLATAPARAVEVDPMLPKESEQVIFVNLKQIFGSDVVKRLVLPKAKEALTMGEVPAILEALGLDPFKDLETVTAGIWEKEQGQPPNVLAVIRGTFDAEKLYKGADDLGVKFADKVKISFVEEGDYKLVKLAGMNGPAFFVAVADAKTLVAGTDAAVVAASLTAKKEKSKARLSKEMTALVLRQDAKASLFVCQRTENKLDKIPINVGALAGIDGDQLKEQLGKVMSVCFTVRVGKEIAVEVTAGMKDADAAEGFGANVEKLFGLAKTFLGVTAVAAAPKYKPITDEVVATLKHEVKKSDVVASVRLSAEALIQVFGEDE